jgi:hypothetical protein
VIYLAVAFSCIRSLKLLMLRTSPPVWLWSVPHYSWGLFKNRNGYAGGWLWELARECKLELDFRFRLVRALVAHLILVCFLNLIVPFHFPLLAVSCPDSHGNASTQ